MATNKDRVALPPTDAQKTNLTCHFCIVGCGYHVYKWPENQEGGRAPDENALGLDFRKQLPPLAVTMTPAMQNTITDKDGKRYNIMIVPDTPWTDRNVVPYYKGTWASIRRIGKVEEFKERISFKTRRFST